ncbi:hypothetical protein BHE74_00057768, partial [Ensete ventricosum]
MLYSSPDPFPKSAGLRSVLSSVRSMATITDGRQRWLYAKRTRTWNLRTDRAPLHEMRDKNALGQTHQDPYPKCFATPKWLQVGGASKRYRC